MTEQPDTEQPDTEQPDTEQPGSGQPVPEKAATPAPVPFDTEHRGGGIIAASLAGTAVLLVVSVLSVTVEAADLVAALVDLAMFAAGVVVFLWAYGIAVGRSRTDEIGIGGLYFLAGTAPMRVRVRLLGSLAAEVVIAFTAAGIRPYSSVAFAILTPMWALGLAGLWGARYGRFGPRSLADRGR